MMLANMFELSSPPSPEVVSLIAEGIAQANEQACVERYDFSIIHRERGAILGGVTASISFAVLFINNNWVDANSRGCGVGSKLMAAAEEEGRRLGATTACVDTLTTQVPGFYTRLGYSEFGRLEGVVSGSPVDRVWFKRSL
jgi:ribosomal protein S18 acetylase RimI-like enzyme